MMQHITTRPTMGARIDYSHPLAKGLVGCWLLNDTGYRAFDSSPYGNHGVLNGFDSPPKRGWYGTQFDGVNDYVNAGNGASLNITNAVTVEAWIYVNNYPSVDYAYILSKGIAFSSEGSWTVGMTISGRGYFFLRKGDNTAYNYSGYWSAIPLKTWTLITHIFDGNTGMAYTYKNGVLDVSTNIGYTSIYSNTNSVLIGGSSTGSGTRYFNGTIDEVRIYNRALSASEVQQLYINPYQIFR